MTDFVDQWCPLIMWSCSCCINLKEALSYVCIKMIVVIVRCCDDDEQEKKKQGERQKQNLFFSIHCPSDVLN